MHRTNFRIWCLLEIFLLVMVFINGEIIDESSSIQTTTDDDNTTKDFLSITSEDTTIAISTETPEICVVDISNGINIVNRTSTMFTGLIDLNCSSINSSELFIFMNGTLLNNCYINKDINNNNRINVTCNSIENNAGRNLTFTLVEINFINEIILNETFVITLEPLSLSTSTNISIEIHDDLTSASIFISNCLNISDPEYLIIRCNHLDLLNNTLSDNCTYICDDLQPGSIYNLSLIRLPITIIDKNDQIFQQEILHQIYTIDLDKVTNLSFDENCTDNNIALITFNNPRGNYDEIYLNCSSEDQHCSNAPIILTNSTENCSNCTSISISPIRKGVSYKCQAITIKENFPNITSVELIFNTPLQPIVYNKPGQLFSHSSHFIFNVTPESDFDYIQSFCIIDKNQTFPCSNLTKIHEECLTVLTYNGILGCNYRCYFVTKKVNYSDEYSNDYVMHLFPPQANLFLSGKGSRWISIGWKFNENVYVKSFELYLNQNLIGNLSKEIFSYNSTKLLPNQDYTFRVKVISNYNPLSEPLLIKTSEEAPEIPTNDDIKSKIIPLRNDIESKCEQFAIEIDQSLFSNQYGIVQFYQIYVRQDQNKHTTKLDSVGRYIDAIKNESIDYLALIISISSLKTDFRKTNKKLRIIIGNQSLCKDNKNASIPCNGKLKPNKIYKILVSGCANPGCTSVLSQAFRTQNVIEKSGSKGWVAIFPILILLIIGGLGIWKRKKVKSFYDRNIKNFGKNEESSMHFKSDGSVISLATIIKQIRPKLLIDYINLTREDEKSIYAEYKELESMSPQYRQSNCEIKYKSYNRYPNISARGPWNRTAVRLTDRNRLHDYINANEINSYDNKKQYIACQGPMEETSQDFWDMIIQYQVSTIIMLTKTEERNPDNPSKPLSKCYRYFPTNVDDILIFGETVVKVVDIEYYYSSDLEIRYISVIQDGVPEQWLIHYYFTAWPDYNIIEPKKLLDLIETINKHRQYLFNLNEETTQISSAPTVVHCSAGVGRTGTYIAVETIIRLLDRPNEELPTTKLDIMGIVYHLRKDRVKMVQTKEQYMLVNRCVEEHLKQTRRLDFISRRSHIYENEKIYSSRSSPNIYINLQKPNNLTSSRRNMMDRSSHYVNLAPTKSVSQRSNTQEHVVNGHKHRFNTEIPNSTYQRLSNNYYLKTEDDDSNDYMVPPLPPRRSRSAQSSSKSQQSDT